MAILNFTGFETGNSVEFNATSGTFDAAYTTVKRTGTYGLRSNPTTTAIGYVKLFVQAATGLNAQASLTAIFSTFYFRYATKPAANNEPFFAVLSSIASIVTLRLRSDGKLEIYDQADVFIATGTAVLAADTWYRIDFRIDVTADTEEVKVDGTVDISATGVISGTIAGVGIGKVSNANGQTVDFAYDDVAIDDTAYPGAGEVKLGVPIGAGAASGWTAGTNADNFAEVDEVPHDTDTTYIGALATEDNLDHTFNMQAAATIGIAGTIGAVKTIVVARTDSITGASTVAHRRLSGGSAFELTALELTTTYALLAKVDVTDPFDAGAWTPTKFDTLEVGMAANTLAQVQRFTAAYVQAWSAGGPAANPLPRHRVISQAVKRAAYW